MRPRYTEARFVEPHESGAKPVNGRSSLEVEVLRRLRFPRTRAGVTESKKEGTPNVASNHCQLNPPRSDRRLLLPARRQRRPGPEEEHPAAQLEARAGVRQR